MKRIALLVGSFLLLLPQLVGASSFNGLDARPARPDPNNQEAARWFSFSVRPGETISNELLVANQTASPKSVTLYVADAVPGTSGVFRAKGATMTGVGTWIKVTPLPVTIPAGSSTLIPFTVSVPVGTSAGEYASGIMLEEKDALIFSKLNVSSRLGVTVYVNVASSLFPGFQKKLQRPVSQETNMHLLNAAASSLSVGMLLIYQKKRRKKKLAAVPPPKPARKTYVRKGGGGAVKKKRVTKPRVKKTPPPEQQNTPI